MRTYFAFDDEMSVSQGFNECLRWAYQRISLGESSIVKIASVRPEDREARVIGEVTAEGFALTRAGRMVPLRRLIGR